MVIRLGFFVASSLNVPFQELSGISRSGENSRSPLMPRLPTLLNFSPRQFWPSASTLTNFQTPCNFSSSAWAFLLLATTSSCLAAGVSPSCCHFDPDWSPAKREYESAPPPMLMMLMVMNTAMTALILVANIVFNTPSVRTATLAVTTPAAAICPAAHKPAALIALEIIVGGTQADAAFLDTTAAKAAPVIANPCRVNRLASIFRARDSRTES